MQAHTSGQTRRLPDEVMLAGLVLGGIIVIWAANHFGLWWVTALVGVAIGLALRGTLRIVAVTSIAAVSGWGLALLWQSLGTNVGGAASTVALIMGFGPSGVIVILLALIFAWLLSLAGAWLGAALRRVMVPLARRAS